MPTTRRAGVGPPINWELIGPWDLLLKVIGEEKIDRAMRQQLEIAILTAKTQAAALNRRLTEVQAALRPIIAEAVEVEANATALASLSVPSTPKLDEGFPAIGASETMLPSEELDVVDASPVIQTEPGIPNPAGDPGDAGISTIAMRSDAVIPGVGSVEASAKVRGDLFFKGEGVTQEGIEFSFSDRGARVTTADTTSGPLSTKLVAGAGITLTILNPGADEDLEIAWTGTDVIVLQQPLLLMPPVTLRPGNSWLGVGPEFSVDAFSLFAIRKVSIRWAASPSGGTNAAEIRLRDTGNNLTLWSLTHADGGFTEEAICSSAALSNIPADCSKLQFQVQFDAADTGTIAIYACPSLWVKKST